ncbi:MAG: LysR family transcriptional regulator [Romboutsia sp.]
MEKELGVKLFERSNRGVELTDKGQILYNYAKRILFLHSNLIEEIEEESSIKQEIKISISSTCSNFITEIMSNDIIKIFNNVNINISINNSKDISDKALLIHNRADIVIGCNNIEDSDLICNHIDKDKLILVSKKAVECHERSKLSIAILDDSLNMALKNIEKLNPSNISLRSDSIDVIKAYLKNNNVAAIVPRISVDKELKFGELVTLCSNAYAMEYNLFMTYNKDMDANMKKKLKKLKIELENILSKELVSV